MAPTFGPSSGHRGNSIYDPWYPRITHGIMKQIAQRAGRKSMLRKLVIGVLGAMAVLFSTTAFAQGTAAEAKAMLDRAVAAVKADKTKALDTFNKGEGGFLDRDLYPFCFN